MATGNQAIQIKLGTLLQPVRQQLVRHRQRGGGREAMQAIPGKTEGIALR